jgi:3-oxoacyl-[acyl-carrier-protein] synthase II
VNREPVLITGLGAVSALGHGLDEMWAALAAGRDGMAPIARFSTEVFTTHLGGMVPCDDRLKPDDGEAMERLVIRFAVDAGREALRRSGVRIVDARRVALVLGTSMGSHLGGLHETSSKVARALGIAGPVITISTACASSTNALGTGRELLDEGAADVVLAGGSDVLCPEIFAGFHALGLLSATRCAPFSESMGTTLGEGAGFLVLEREADARARKAPVVACLSGYALSADGYHATSPEPSGAGVARALKATLDDAGLSAEQIGYVNAHGTGTAANDPAEWTAISSVLGARAATVPVSSTKSYLAHAQGAAGVLELIATLLAWAHGQVLPTLHLARPRKRSPVDAVAQPTPRVHAFEHALATNSAFGGANAAVSVSRGAPPRRAVKRREVFVAGVGVLGPFGQTLEALAAWQGGGARLAPFSLEALAPNADARGMDQSGCSLVAAVALALADAKVKVSGAARERTGLFVGTTNASPAAWDEFRVSSRERGLAKVSAPAFTRLVLNASAGFATRVFGLRGPTTTLTTGQGSGLVALALGAAHLATRAEVDRLVVAAVDEADLSRAPHDADAAVAVVLTTEPAEGAVRVARWALGGEGAVESRRPVPAVASGSLLELALAFGDLRAGAGTRRVVDGSVATSCEVTLTRGE